MICLRLRERSSCTMFLAALLALSLPACKKKPPEEPVPAASNTAGAAGTGGAATATATAAGAAAEPAAKPEPAPKATSGCTLPEAFNADVTLVKGCTLVVKQPINLQEGATLTLEPGVKLSFDSNAYLWVAKGKLVAKGTAEAPITLTSANKTPAAGDWYGIGFDGETQAGTELEHVVIEYAGRKGQTNGAVDLRARLERRVSIVSSTIRHSDQAAVHAAEGGAFARFEGNTLTDNKVSLHVHSEVLGSLGPNNKLGAPVEVLGDVGASMTWPALDVPIVVTEKIQVGGESKAAILTLPEGATLKFAMGTYLSVGTGDGGGLVAKKVTFASNNDKPAAGDWVGIFFYDKVTNTVLEGCTISHAGRDEASGRGAVTYYGAKPGPSVVITGTTFSDNKKAAISGDDGDCGDAAKPASKNKSEGAPLCGPKE